MTVNKSKFLLKIHPFYAARVHALKLRVAKLKATLRSEEFREHPDVKFAARLRKATLEIIPHDPDLPDYRLKGSLKNFRRYKQGLQRYRLFFCFASTPPIIVYLYVNDEHSLRKDGSQNDPYQLFSKWVAQGKISSDPQSPLLQQWLTDMI